MHIYKNNDTPIASCLNYYKVSDLIIDMTGWMNKDRSLPDTKGIYPYTACFTDVDNVRHEFMCDDMSLNGFESFVNYLRESQHVIILDTTKVTIVCPADIQEQYYNQPSHMQTCRIVDLRDQAMKALNLRVTHEGRMNVQIESVLDSAVHQVCAAYEKSPRKRNLIFCNSVFHYDEEDARHFDACKKMTFQTWDQEFFE